MFSCETDIFIRISFSVVEPRHAQTLPEKDGAHARPPMLSAGFGVDSRHFYRAGGLLVVLCLRGGALCM